MINQINQIAIIGTGGTASFLAPAANLLLSGENSKLVLMDADIVEKHNLSRQIFAKQDIGKPKAGAMARKLSRSRDDVTVSFVQEYLSTDTELELIEALDVESEPVLICCADNHPARLTTLGLAEEYKLPAVICGNEFWDSEAYIFFPEWAGSGLDPRVYYPELLTETQGDPLRPPCTGDAQIENKQLVTANMNAASLAGQLLTFWFLKKDTEKLEGYEPYRISSAATGCRYFKTGETNDNA